MEAERRLFPLIKGMGDTEVLCPGAHRACRVSRLRSVIAYLWVQTLVSALCELGQAAVLPFFGDTSVSLSPSPSHVLEWAPHRHGCSCVLFPP